MRHLLMVAFHFPPQTGSSGIQRTLRFARHLPLLGWKPLILSANPRAYEQTGSDLSEEIPPGTFVERAFALDTARHLSIGKRYLGAMARPDRWISWKYDAVRRGMCIIEKFRPDAIWSTYPIATAHLIGAELNARSGVPWIADFRDPMAQEGYPADHETWASFKRIEKTVFRQAHQCIFTTPGAAQMYRERYPEVAHKVAIIENGYDEETFASLPAPSALRDIKRSGPITLLHSGIVYPSERDPSALFEALRRIKSVPAADLPEFRIRFRAAVHDDMIQTMARKNGISDMIECAPPIPYREALSEMLAADGLLVLQAANCNEQIPAKIYEYLRAQRPILALTDPVGDTADLIQRAGITTIAPLDNAELIKNAILQFIRAIDLGATELPAQGFVEAASRESRALQLSVLLNQL